MPHDVVITVRIGPDYYAELKERLERYGITQSALAEKAGLSKSAITHHFKRGYGPRIRTVEKLERALAEIRAERAAQRKR